MRLMRHIGHRTPRNAAQASGGNSARHFGKEPRYLGLGRKPARLRARITHCTVNLDIELPRATLAQLDAGHAQFDKNVSHPESLRLVASAAAVMDDDVHQVRPSKVVARQSGDGAAS